MVHVQINSGAEIFLLRHPGAGAMLAPLVVPEILVGSAALAGRPVLFLRARISKI